jgi:tetratricopeptide (TPR) repeat protein
MADPNDQIKSDLFAARTEAFQQAKTTNVFKTLLFIIAIIVGLILVAQCVAKRTVAPATVGVPFNETKVRHKIIGLEKEIALLKSDLALVKKPSGFIHFTQTAATFVISNWVLLSFLVAVATAIYVKIRFKIDYFESYRDLATKKMLSEFYRHLGDRLMISSEWDAAEIAYRDSLAINPTNIKATYGIAKVSVFQPLKGEEIYATEIADRKLDYLIANPPPNATSEDLRRDFAQLYFLKGISRSNAGDDAQGRTWQQKAIETDPMFVGPHLELGYIHETAGEIEQAINCYKKAVELDKDLALANNNLGGMYLIIAEFDKAIEYLERARKISPSLMTTLTLGEAYAYARQFNQALAWHKKAWSNLAVPGIEKERYVTFGSTWSYSFMPLQKGDSETIKRNIKIYTLDEKKILTISELAFDHALLGNLKRAHERFAEARAIKGADDYADFFLNRIQSMLNLIEPEPVARKCLEEMAAELSTPIS